MESGPGVEAEVLDPKVVRFWQAGTLVRAFILALAVLVAEAVVLPWSPGVASGAVLALGSVYGLAWPGLRYRSWEYRVGEEHLRLRRGVVWRTESMVPHVRVQHVDVRRGPLDRWLGLARVVVFTAGTRGAMVEIPGLDVARAGRLRDRLIELSGAGDAV